MSKARQKPYRISILMDGENPYEEAENKTHMLFGPPLDKIKKLQKEVEDGIENKDGLNLWWYTIRLSLENQQPYADRCAIGRKTGDWSKEPPRRF